MLKTDHQKIYDLLTRLIRLDDLQLSGTILRNHPTDIDGLILAYEELAEYLERMIQNAFEREQRIARLVKELKDVNN